MKIPFYVNGGGSTDYEIESGTFTPSADTYTVNIPTKRTSLSEISNFFIVPEAISDSAYMTGKVESVCLMKKYFSDGRGVYTDYVAAQFTNSAADSSAKTNVLSVSGGNLTVNFGSGYISKQFSSKITYRYYIIHKK